MLDRLAAHFSRYSLANGLVTVASIVSFPILTRVLGVDEYGLLSLIGVLVTMLVAVGKLGLQHAALRFYSEIRAGASRFTLPQYEATVLVGLAGGGLAIGLAWLVVSQLLPAGLWNDDRMRPLLALTAGLVFLQCLSSAFVNQLRARELSTELSVYTVVKRWFDLGLILGVLLLVSASVRGFFGALLVAEAVSTAALAVWFLRRFPCRPADASPALLGSMLAFGLPLILTELSSVMLSLGDRFVVQRLLGADALGIYAAPYNLCETLGSVLVVAFIGSVQPMMLRTWADHGPTRTAAFLGEVTQLYLLFAIPLVVGVSAVGEPMLAVFASDKYRDGAVVIPWIIAGLALQGLFPVASAGLQVRKQSGRILTAILTAAVANLLLNLLLVPRLGITGAAIATLASYGLMIGLAITCDRGTLPLRLDAARTMRFLLAAAVMYAAVTAIRMPGDVATLAWRVLAGLLVYPAVLLAIDAPSRRMLAGVGARLGVAGSGR